MAAPPRPRGRPPSRAWLFFTPVTEPQKLESTTCRHCNQLVLYRKKWAIARAHLMKCDQFLQLMDSSTPSDVPEWYLAEIKRRQLKLKRIKAPKDLKVPQPPQTETTTFKVIQPVPVAVAAMPTVMQNVAENGVKVDVKKVEENVAMHLFTTMQMEKLLEENFELPFLMEIFGGYPEFKLPTKEKLMTELLDQCCENVKVRVDGFFKSGVVPVSLTVDFDIIGEGDAVVNYMAALASSEKYPMYLESVQAQNSGDAEANAEWAARDVARVLEKLTCPVAGCVMPCSTMDSRQTRQLLEKEFPSMHFHGCMRDGLLSFIQQLFSPSVRAGPDRKRAVTVPFFQDLQQFALQCKDLSFFLPRQETPWYLDGCLSCTNNMLHVTARRRLTVEEAYVAVLQAEPFLDVDSVMNQLFSSGSNGMDSDGHHAVNVAHLQTQLVKMVRSPQFVEKLRKYLEVLRPVHTVLFALRDESSLLLSEVYSSFSRLSRQFASITILLSDEKASLQALVRQQQERVLGPAHVLAYLLDPVLLGEDLPMDTKTDMEQKLLTSFGADADKEALYTQYADYKKFALNQKANKSETLGFRRLKERKKSPLQFWFSDGAKWPVLQAIACRIFVMPVCAISSPRVVLDAWVSRSLIGKKADMLTSEKLTYIRVNTRQLDRATVAGSSLDGMGQNPPSGSSVNDITASMIV
ncbi:Transposase [Phytophthora megakarya]|uniref:Transposase n=1 Tax=Phytophthora megakarya TaxID=4795 RepID=A0A225VHG3_9STRA|nr:Transposase [Phytophthora megakarya]